MFVRGRRMAGVWTGVVLALALATGCTPEPAPSPTPTGFASEEEAFRAAEATYRAYVDALNQVDLSDPETFEPVFAWTTGDLKAQDKKQLSTYYAERAQVSGRSTLTVVEPREWDTTSGAVTVAACVDVSQVEVVDANGNSLVSPERPDFQQTLATLTPGGSPTALLIETIDGREGPPTCGE